MVFLKIIELCTLTSLRCILFSNRLLPPSNTMLILTDILLASMIDFSGSATLENTDIVTLGPV